MKLFRSTDSAQLLHAGRVASGGAWHMGVDSHAFHELVCVVRGRVRVRSGRQEVEALPGDILLYPAGVAHEEFSGENEAMEIVFMAFACDFAGRRSVYLARDAHRRVVEIVRWFYEDELESGAMPAAAKSALLTALLEDVSHATKSDGTPEWVRRVRHRILADIAQPVTLADLAQTAGMSPFHFIRRYKTATGRSPMADVRMMRLNHARQLILGTALPIKEIAHLAGFGGVQAMTRAFSRDLGVTPAQLRRKT